jgi:hypothetical protein
VNKRKIIKLVFKKFFKRKKISLIIHVNTKLVGSQQDLAKINPYAFQAVLNPKQIDTLIDQSL